MTLAAVLCCAVCFLAATSVSAQTISQKGVAYQYNGKQARTPLGNVTISYDGNQRTTISGERDGTFSLTLAGRKMGDRIGMVTVRKREMIVFNQQAVDEWSVRKEPLRLILCDADEFERQKENLIAIGKREAKKKYDRQKAKLEQQLADGKMQLAEKEAALNKAYEELERARNNMDEYADLFARIDESEVDTLAQQAIELFNQGEVERAIRKFEEGHYMEKLDNAIKNSKQADKLMAVAEQAKERATQDSLKAVQSLKAQIEAYKLNNEWEKAGELLKGLADKSGDVGEICAYALFCLVQNKFGESETYYNKALTIFRRLAESNPSAYKANVAITLNELAIVYAKTQRFSEAESMNKEALEELRRLAESNPSVYEHVLGNTLNNMALVYVNTKHFSEAESMYKEALEIRRRLAAANPKAYERDLAQTLSNLALLNIRLQHFSEAESMHKEALEIRRRLAAANPSAFEPDVATSLNNLALLYDKTQRLNETEPVLKEALEIRRRLAANNPSAYEPDLAQTMNDLASTYCLEKRFSEAEPMLKEALEIRRRLAAANPTVYEPDWAMTMNNLALLYADTQRFSEAEQICKETAEIYRRLASSNPSAYEPDFIQVLNNLAMICEFTKRYSDKDAALKEILEIKRRMGETGPKLTETLGRLSYSKILLRKYAESEQYAREAIATDSTQHWVATNLAAALLFQGKYTEAEQIYRQYKSEMKEAYLADFKAFSEAGVIPKEYEADVEKIKKMLNEE